MSPKPSGLARKAGFRKPSRRLLALFDVYLQWYIGRHFHGLRLAHGSRFPAASRPLIVCLNHASWWDPLTAIVLSRHWLPRADHYAPMEEAALAHYGFMRKLGLFPIESGTPRGAVQFLRAARDILAEPDSVLWITPEGRFTDVRARPVSLRPGLAALISRLGACTVVPLAIEYIFWDERLPEILVSCGEPVVNADGSAHPAAEWNILLASAMTVAQDELGALAALRDPSRFETVISGAAGMGNLYGRWKGQSWRSRRERSQRNEGGA